MAYTPFTWVDDSSVITAARLQNMEDEIESITDGAHTFAGVKTFSAQPVFSAGIDVNGVSDFGNFGVSNFKLDTKLDANKKVIAPFSLGSETELTISGGIITITENFHTVDTESDDVTDDLVTINGGVAGMLLVLRNVDNTRDVVIKDATGNIHLEGSADYTLGTTGNNILLFFMGGVWREITRNDTV